MASFVAVEKAKAYLEEKVDLNARLERTFFEYAEKGTTSQETQRKELETVTLLKLSGTETDIFRVDQAHMKEYSSDELKQAVMENPNIIDTSAHCLAHLNKRGLLLNSKGIVAKTGKVLILVLSFVLLEARRILNDDQLTSISIVVGNMVENRQDRKDGLDLAMHRRFRPWHFQPKDGSVSIQGYWAFGEVQEEYGKDFFLKLAQVFRKHACETKSSLILLTSKGTEAGLNNGVLPMLSERENVGIEIACRGHPSCTSLTGKEKMQAASSDILRSVTNGRGPLRGSFLNAWVDKAENQNMFASDITIEAISADSRRTTQSVTKDDLFGAYESTASKVVKEAEKIAREAEKAAKMATREAEKKVAEELKKVTLAVRDLPNKILFNKAGTKDEGQDFFADIDSAKIIINGVNVVNVFDAIEEDLEELCDIESERKSLLREHHVNRNELTSRITRLESNRASAINRIYELCSLISPSTSKKKKGEEVEKQKRERQKKQTEDPVDYLMGM